MRQDHKIFFDNIKPHSKVMDIGCGEGEFLEALKKERSCRTFGIEIDPEKVASALNKGISVIQSDADKDLEFYPGKDNAPDPFDYIVLANTLQVMRKPKKTLEQSKERAKKVLVSIPNFGYIANRFYLFRKGRMPVTKQLSYEWYETPNIHFSTITDFMELARKVGFNIERAYYVDAGGESKEFHPNNPTIANLFGKEGVFILS